MSIIDDVRKHYPYSGFARIYGPHEKLYEQFVARAVELLDSDQEDIDALFDALEDWLEHQLDVY